MNKSNKLPIISDIKDSNVGSSIITFGTILNASYLIDGNPLTVSSILDLFALIEDIVFNENLYFIPINEKEVSHHANTELFNCLLGDNIITQYNLSDNNENKIAATLYSESEKYRGNETFDRIFNKISKTLKTPKLYRENAFAKIYNKKTIEAIRNNTITTTIFDNWQKTI